MLSTDKIFSIFFTLVPFLLITGPALPDITITLCAIYFLITFIFINKNYDFIKDKFFLVSIFFGFAFYLFPFLQMIKLNLFKIP